MTYWHWLLTLFKKPSKKYSSTICFKINSETKTIDINCEWNKLTLQDAKEFAQLLYQLNSGILSGHISQQMLAISNTKPELAEFVHHVIINWGSNALDTLSILENNKNNLGLTNGPADNEPLVKPSQVFDKFKNYGQQT